MNNYRRNFIKNTIKGAAAVAVGGILPSFTSKSYAAIIGANDRINVGVMGVHSRGLALAKNFATQKNARVISVSDVDNRAADTCIGEVENIQKSRPLAIPDFRKALEQKDMDALVIAAPDHWHAPAAILATKAGKHVYLEKPCSHTPNEGELLVKVVEKYKNVMQMGNQRRSWPNVATAIAELHGGIIGRPYFAKTWYTNNRPSIGKGKEAAIPSWLNYELWQGPAPRQPYKDNLIHYNWHWFWTWGTGEAANNGVHTIDLARWGLNVDFPNRVTSAGGRYRYQDDWQTPDTQVITLEFNNNSSITWEGRSCNGYNSEGQSRGVIFYGDNGTVVYPGANNYQIFDGASKLVYASKDDTVYDATNTVSPFETLDTLHLNNFAEAIRGKEKINAPILEGHKSTLLPQLGNIAYRVGRALKCDPSNGHILNDQEAMNFWTREYEKNWNVVV